MKLRYNLNWAKFEKKNAGNRLGILLDYYDILIDIPLSSSNLRKVGIFAYSDHPSYGPYAGVNQF